MDMQDEMALDRYQLPYQRLCKSRRRIVDTLIAAGATPERRSENE